MKRNFLDGIISYFSPKRGAARLYHRTYIHTLERAAARHFEAGSKTGRTSKWKRPKTSADSALAPFNSTMRSTAREMVRNNPYAERIVAGLKNNIVGTGIRPKFRHKNKAKAKTFGLKFWDFAHTTQCDFNDQLDFYGLQGLAVRAVAESGECLARRVWNKDKKTFGFEIQLLEPDFIDDTRNLEITPQGGRIMHGIEYDAKGKRVAYWLWNNHPGDTMALRSFKSERIPAEDIIHLYDVKRIGQTRGYSWLAPILVRLNEFDQYEDAQLVKQRVSAAWCAFIRDITAPEGATGLNNMGGVENEDQLEFLTAGVIEHLPPGKEIQFAQPPAVNGYAEYAVEILRSCATGAGVTYELMTGDYSKVNFSSGRMGWIEFARSIAGWRKDIVINQFCAGVMKWIESSAPIMGVDMKDLETIWVTPRREMIDPTKEVPAQVAKVNGGLQSLSNEILANGDDPEEVFQSIAEDKAMLKTLGIEVGAYEKKADNAGGFGPPGQSESSKKEDVDADES